jgi:hypothetical protein
MCRIDLSNNALTGSIPDSWSKLAGVESISLAGNKFSGSVSSAWARTPATSSLALLNISGNVGMKGCLLDSRGKPGTYFPFIDARGTSLDCPKSRTAGAMANAPGPGWSPASCKVDKYSLRPQQLPNKWVEEWKSVTLYTLHPQNNRKEAPFSLPTLAATKAACDALDACVMFTSDGYLIGVYRQTSQTSHVADLQAALHYESRLGPWQWRKMAYCSGKCCGTWVSGALNTTALASNQAVVTSNFTFEKELPAASESVGTAMAQLTVDAGKQCQAMRSGNIDVSTAITCPKRCRVGCCVEAEQWLSSKHFHQCSAHVCRLSCGFDLVEVRAVSAPFSKQTVALYLKQKSKGKAPPAGGRRKDGNSKGCTGSLC